MRVVVEYANRLSARGHEIALIFPNGFGDEDIFQEMAPAVKLLAAGRKFSPRVSPFSMLEITRALARAVPASDVIFSTQTPTTPAGWLAHRRIKGSKLVWLYQDYREMFLGRPLEDWLIRHALSWHDGAFAISTPARDELLSHSKGAVKVVGEGLTGMGFFSPLLPEERRYDAQGRKTILFLGDMRPRKGWDDFLAAASTLHQRMPETVFWIVSKDVCQITEAFPYEFIFRPSRAELARLYGSCDVFVSASWWESFGLPPLEAMACGAPVVLTDSRGVREYAVPGKNCLMVPPRAPELLANAIFELLNSPAQVAQFRQNGPLTAAPFTWEAAVERFDLALEDLFKKKGVTTQT